MLLHIPNKYLPLIVGAIENYKIKLRDMFPEIPIEDINNWAEEMNYLNELDSKLTKKM